jgi:cell division protein YceG involved in septum cleavage
MIQSREATLEPDFIKSEAKKLGMIDPVEYFDKTDKEKGNLQLDAQNEDKIIVEIPKGVTSEDVSEILKEKNLIASKKEFLNKIHEKGLTYKIKWGTYEFSPDTSEADIIHIIAQEGN